MQEASPGPRVPSSPDVCPYHTLRPGPPPFPPENTGPNQEASEAPGVLSSRPLWLHLPSSLPPTCGTNPHFLCKPLLCRPGALCTDPWLLGPLCGGEALILRA